MVQETRPLTLVDAIGDDAWAELRARMERRVYSPGDVLIAQGTLIPDFHIIVEGTASVEATGPQGQRRGLGTLSPGDAAGDMALLTGDPASADVVARTRVVTFAIAPPQLAELEAPRHRLFEALAQLLAGRLRTANLRVLAQRAAHRHVLRCPPVLFAAIQRLPGEIARVANRPVLIVTVGDGWPTVSAARNVEVRSVAGRAELAGMLDRCELEYDRIVVLLPPGSDIAVEGAASSFEICDADGPPPPASDLATIAVGAGRWTQPELRRIGARVSRNVVGLLPPDGGAPGYGDPVAKAARLITGNRVGLALGAGAAKGLAHIGVLRAVEDLQIDVDIISGCSIGAAIAAAYAGGYHSDRLQETVTRVAARALRPTLPLHSFLSNRGIRDEIERISEGRRFEDLDLPLAIPAVDIFRRCEITFTTGLVWPRILASMAIPGIYPPMRAGDSYLVDGSVLTPVPVRQCRELGAGLVIGVRLTGARTSPRDELDFDPTRPLAPDTITRCFEIMNNRLSELSRGDADASIEVMLERGGLRDFDRAAEYAAAGYAATIAARDTLVGVMPWVGAAA